MSPALEQINCHNLRDNPAKIGNLFIKSKYYNQHIADLFGFLIEYQYIVQRLMKFEIHQFAYK